MIATARADPFSVLLSRQGERRGGTALKRLFTAAIISFCAVALSACGHASQSGSASDILPQGVYGGIGPSASIAVLLGDAPPDLYGRPLAQLNLGLKEVDAIENGQTTVLSTFQKPLVVNVLNDPGNGGQIVANAKVARLAYQQLRLVVDLATSTGVFADGTKMPIDFFTNQQSYSTVGAGSNTTTSPAANNTVAITVTQPFSIPEDGNPAVRVDFNAFESLDLWAQGGLVAQPALFVAPVDDAGSISGKIVDRRTGQAVNQAVIVATASDGSIGNTAVSGSDGTFSLHTLRSGSYNLVIWNDYTNAAGRTFTSTSSSPYAAVNGPTVTVEGGQDSAAGNLQD